MSDPDDDAALRELAGLMRAGGLQRFRELLELAPVLLELADCQRLLEADAANERPRPRLAPVHEDGSIVLLVACPKRMQAQLDLGESAPLCRWMPLPGVHGYECKTCGRPELGEDRVEALDKLFGRSPA